MEKVFHLFCLWNSLRSKRFQSSYCAKLRAGAKKKKGGRGRRRGEEEVPSFPFPSPVIPFFALVPTFLDELAQKRLLHRLLVKERSIRQKAKIGDYQIKQQKEINTESIRKLSNFYFQWTKTLYQNKFTQIAFF